MPDDSATSTGYQNNPAYGRGRGGLKRVFKRYGPGIAGTGYQTMWDILSGQGRTDPALMNRNLMDISRQSQIGQQQAQGYLSQMGLSGSGAGAGLLAALGQAGADTRANYLARETALEEERKRQDLQLMQLLFGPKFQRRALDQQMQIARMGQQGGGQFDWGGLFNLGANVAQNWGG